MNKIKIIFLSMFLLCCAQNVLAKAFPYAGDLTGGVNGSDENWDSYVDLMLPVAGSEKSFLFIAPRLSNTGESVFESSANEFNIGIGFRQYLEKFLKDGVILGFNAYYDMRNTSLGNSYQQAGAGFELLSKWLDLRVNGYFPFGNSEYFLGKSYDAPSQHYIASTYYYEVSMSGVDCELGLRIPLPAWAGELRAFGGYYYFDADNTDALKGFKGRAEYRPLNILKFNYTIYENEDLAGTDWQAGAEIKIPLDLRKFLQGKNPFMGLWDYIKTRPLPLKDRIGEMVVRDMYVRVKNSAIVHKDEKLQSESGADLYFTVVKPGGTGDGTFENPANLADGTQMNKAVTGDNAVLLLLGGLYTLDSTLDLSGHLADEVLLIGQQEVSYRGGDLSKITNGNPIIKTSSDTTAFKLDSSDAEEFLVSSIEFTGTGNTGTGLEISNYDKDILVRNNSFSGFETGVKVDNSSTSVVFYNNIFENNITGAEISGLAAYFEENQFSDNLAQSILLSNSSGAVVIYNVIESTDGASGITVSGGQNSIITINEINGGGYGIYLSGSDYMKALGNKITSTTVSGIYASVDNSAEISANKVYGNYGDGISAVDSTGTIVSSNYIYDNDKDGIYVYGGNGLLVELNDLYKNKENGLYAEGVSNALFSQNTSTNNAVNGMYFKDISNSEISGNKSSTNTVSGICLFNGSGVIISSNAVYYNETGILAEGGAGVQISSNIADNNKEGIKASGITDFVALSNDVSSNTAGGMYFINMSSAQIINNFAQHNKGYGAIYVENLNDSSVNSNVVALNESAGITVKNSSNTSVSYNGFDNDNTGSGLYLIDSSNVKMTWNVFQTYGTSSYFGLYMQGAVTFDAVGSGANRFFNSSYGGDAANYENDVKPNDYFY